MGRMRNWEYALARTLEQRWKSYRKALKNCQRKFSEGSIHVSRIEARRLAAQLDLLRVFAPRRVLEKAHRCIKHHLDTFDPLRDVQVQLGILKKECGGISGTKAVCKILAKRERKCRRAAKRRIRQIKTRSSRNVVEMLVERLQERGKSPERMRRDRGIILHSVETAFAHVVECRRQMNAVEPATIHRARVAFKRFRYMMEAMRPLLPGITPRRLEAMKAFQGLLGDLQDTDVFLARVDKFIAKDRIEIADVAPLRRWLVRRHAHQVNQCLRRADVVFKFWPLSSASVEVM
jgi:CHAD domain-containing protein